MTVITMSLFVHRYPTYYIKPIIKLDILLTLTWINTRFEFIVTKQEVSLTGNKDGALTAMKALEADDLGKLLDKGSHRGTSVVSTAVQSFKMVLNFLHHAQVYKFEKAPIPENNNEDFATKLAKYGLSLQDYQKALKEYNEPLQR